MQSLSAEPITTARLTLEPLRIEHATELAPALDDVALHEFTGGGPYTEQQLRERISVQVQQVSPDGSEVWLNWVMRIDSRTVGYVQATVHEEADVMLADIAWVVAGAWQGMGIGTEASLAMVEWLIEHRVTRFRANIHPRHVASQKVARALSLQPTPVVVDGETRWERNLI